MQRHRHTHLMQCSEVILTGAAIGRVQSTLPNRCQNQSAKSLMKFIQQTLFLKKALGTVGCLTWPELTSGQIMIKSNAQREKNGKKSLIL